MYSEVKSQTNGNLSKFFDCSLGLRQGENLSPIFFVLFINDREKFLQGHFNGLTLLKKSVPKYLITCQVNYIIFFYRCMLMIESY